MTESSCVLAGFSYLSACGMGIFAVVLSPWLVQLQRAVYRDGPALQRGLANATPLWIPFTTGVVILFVCIDWVVRWARKCVPAGDWNVLGVVVVALALALAVTAVIRLIRARIRLGSREPAIEHAEIGSVPDEGAATEPKRSPNLPPERRRVILEFALTYEVAVIVTLIGVGFL